MNKKIKVEVEVDSIKRCYIGGVPDINCPKCKKVIKYDENNYLSYPEKGPEELYYYCHDCDVGIDVDIEIRKAFLELNILSEPYICKDE
jgi:hypothetical protein